MTPVAGQVVRILPFSCVDGPGNRAVVFVAGCNFRCLACHNPHTIHVCNRCGVCAPACPRGAVTPEGHRADLCIGCERCVEACPRSSTPRVATLTPREVLAHLEEALPFISGLTISGGEPTGQPDFVAGLLQEARARGLHTLIDSNGAADLAIWERLEDQADGVVLDLKAIDDSLHQALTGHSLEMTCHALRHLAGRGRLFEVRHLVVPGYTDSEEHCNQLADWMARHAPGVPLSLLAFRPHGVRGLLADRPSPSRERMEWLAGLARGRGVGQVSVRGLLQEHGPGNEDERGRRTPRRD